MGFDAKKWVSVGLRFIPYIGPIVNAVEQVKGAKGPAKLDAVKDAVAVGVEAGEFALDRDLLKDDKVQAALTGYINAYVALQNAVAAAKLATADVKAAPNP